ERRCPAGFFHPLSDGNGFSQREKRKDSLCVCRFRLDIQFLSQPRSRASRFQEMPTLLLRHRTVVIQITTRRKGMTRFSVSPAAVPIPPLAPKRSTALPPAITTQPLA